MITEQSIRIYLPRSTTVKHFSEPWCTHIFIIIIIFITISIPIDWSLKRGRKGGKQQRRDRREGQKDMARRKTKRVLVKKVTKQKMPTSFACPFCNEEASVECKLYFVFSIPKADQYAYSDRSKQTGLARCRACQAGYQTVINCKEH